MTKNITKGSFSKNNNIISFKTRIKTINIHNQNENECITTKFEINYVGSLNVKRQSMNRYKKETDAKLYQNQYFFIDLSFLFIHIFFIYFNKKRLCHNINKYFISCDMKKTKLTTKHKINVYKY